MFQKFFRNLKQFNLPALGRLRSTQGASIDVLIERIGQRHTPEDRRRAYELFLTMPLFAPVVSVGPAADSANANKARAAQKKKNAKAKSKAKKKTARGRKQDAQSSEEQRVTLAMAGVNGYQMFLMYTSGEDARLAEHGERRLELPGRQAFQMALQTPGVDGVLIHNRGNAWMALPNILVQELLEKFPE